MAPSTSTCSTSSSVAEDRGWKATIEEDILRGVGRVDIVLARDGKRIACEISISTDPAVARERSRLRRLACAAETSLGPEGLTRLTICSPEELVVHLSIDDGAATPATIRGYKVRVKYRAPSPADSRTRADAISRVLARGTRRLLTP